ncbi:MAG TPA: hypothetical protein PKY73_09765, partial [Hyphomonas sp.]|nr:hypothetical protein [Hyphomonas sp.]
GTNTVPPCTLRDAPEVRPPRPASRRPEPKNFAEVGLRDFYDWFVGSHTIVALLLEGTGEKTGWPDEVKCDTKRLLDYFSEPGMVKEVYGG